MKKIFIILILIGYTAISFSEIGIFLPIREKLLQDKFDSINSYLIKLPIYYNNKQGDVLFLINRSSIEPIITINHELATEVKDKLITLRADRDKIKDKVVVTITSSKIIFPKDCSVVILGYSVENYSLEEISPKNELLKLSFTISPSRFKDVYIDVATGEVKNIEFSRFKEEYETQIFLPFIEKKVVVKEEEIDFSAINSYLITLSFYDEATQSDKNGHIIVNRSQLKPIVMPSGKFNVSVKEDEIKHGLIVNIKGIFDRSLIIWGFPKELFSLAQVQPHEVIFNYSLNMELSIDTITYIDVLNKEMKIIKKELPEGVIPIIKEVYEPITPEEIKNISHYKKNLTLFTNIKMDEEIRSVSIKEKYLYAAYLTSSYGPEIGRTIIGLAIFDISDLTKIKHIAHSYFPIKPQSEYIYGIELYDKYSYIITDTTVMIIDISNKTLPKLVSSYQAPSRIMDYEIQDNYIYLLLLDTLQIIDQKLKLINSYKFKKSTPLSIKIVNKYAYISTIAGELIILEVNHKKIKFISEIILAKKDYFSIIKIEEIYKKSLLLNTIDFIRKFKDAEELKKEDFVSSQLCIYEIENLSKVKLLKTIILPESDFIVKDSKIEDNKLYISLERIFPTISENYTLLQVFDIDNFELVDEYTTPTKISAFDFDKSKNFFFLGTSYGIIILTLQ